MKSLTHITLLPNEIIFKIFSFCSSNTQILFNLSLVCKQWNIISNDPYIWFILYKNIFNKQLNIPFYIHPKIQYKRMIKLNKIFKGKFENINFQGMNAIHMSCNNRWNLDESIGTLINHGLNIKQTNYSGQTPLHIAVQNRNIEVINYLLQYDNSIVHISDFQGRYPLHIAAGVGDKYICTQLIKAGANPSCIDSQQQTPLHYAAKKGSVNVCRLLAPLLGQQYIELPDVNGNTALLLAASTNKQDCMKILIEEFYANSTVKDRQGRSIMDSVQRLMDITTQKWVECFQIWNPNISFTHGILSSDKIEHDEWNKIAIRDQQIQFAKANSNLLVHYH